MSKKFVLFILFFSVPTFASVKNHSKRFSIGLLFESPSFQMQFRPENKDVNEKVNYVPNTTSLSGYQVGWLGFSASYLRLNKFNENDLENKGKTSYEDVRLSLFFGKKDQFYASTYYNRFKGFYIENSEDIDPSFSGVNKIKRGDLSVFNFGASLMYSFDPSDWSAAALFTQSAQQKKSGGSWIGKLAFDSSFFSSEDDLLLLPSQKRSDFGEDGNIEQGTFGTLSLSAGYGHTFVWNNFFIGFYGMFGKGYQQSKYIVADQDESLKTNSDKLHYGGAFGYNTDWFWAVVSGNIDNTTYKTKSIRIDHTQNNLRGSVGVRF